MFAEHDLIDRDLGKRLSRMARFRNLLIHRYWHIDYNQIYDIVTGPDLEDLRDFMKQVGRLTEKKSIDNICNENIK